MTALLIVKPQMWKEAILEIEEKMRISKVVDPRKKQDVSFTPLDASMLNSLHIVMNWENSRFLGFRVKRKSLTFENFSIATIDKNLILTREVTFTSKI